MILLCLELVLRHRHPLLLGEVAVHQILGGDIDIGGAIAFNVVRLLVVAEYPETGSEETNTGDTCEQGHLFAAHVVIAVEVGRDWRNAVTGRAQGLRLAGEEFGQGH